MKKPKTLQEYVDDLQSLIITRPELKDLPVIYSKDEEDNGFKPIYYTASPGHYVQDDDEFVSEEQIKEEPEEWEEFGTVINAVCVN